MKTTVSEKVSFENETFWREHTETLLHVQSEERYTEIPTQLLFGHPANTN